MPRKPGQEIMECRRTTLEGAGDAEPGDFVALNSDGQVTRTDGTDNPKVTGVLSDSKSNEGGHEAGEKVSVIFGGICVANVTDGVVTGNGIGPSATQGTGTTGGSDGEALSDAGGEFLGPIPAGSAAVNLDGDGGN